MKPIMIVLFFVTMMVFTGFQSKAQPPHAKAWGKRMKDREREKRAEYYYYPSANVYYSPVAQRYWYPRNGVWVNVSVLPASFVITNRPKYAVYCDDGYDVWRYNKVHYEKYHGGQIIITEPRPVKPGVQVNINARF